MEIPRGQEEKEKLAYLADIKTSIGQKLKPFPYEVADDGSWWKTAASPIPLSSALDLLEDMVEPEVVDRLANFEEWNPVCMFIYMTGAPAAGQNFYSADLRIFQRDELAERRNFVFIFSAKEDANDYHFSVDEYLIKDGADNPFKNYFVNNSPSAYQMSALYEAIASPRAVAPVETI